nr:TPA_asm: hypothetical protein [Moniex tapwovirus]
MAHSGKRTNLRDLDSDMAENAPGPSKVPVYQGWTIGAIASGGGIDQPMGFDPILPTVSARTMEGFVLSPNKYAAALVLSLPAGEIWRLSPHMSEKPRD